LGKLRAISIYNRFVYIAKISTLLIKAGPAVALLFSSFEIADIQLISIKFKKK